MTHERVPVSSAEKAPAYDTGVGMTAASATAAESSVISGAS